MLHYTKKELEYLTTSRFVELIEYVGDAAHLAKMLNVSYGTTLNWVRRGIISKAGARLVGDHPALKEKFHSEYLRPDVHVDLKAGK